MRASAASPVGKREAGGGRPQLTSAAARQKEPARAARGRENTGNPPGFETTLESLTMFLVAEKFKPF